MEKFSVLRGALPILFLALLPPLFSGCGKKTETAAAPSATPSAAAATPGGPTPAPPISGQVTPAIVTQDADSISHYLHFPPAAQATRRDGVVQFYCDVTDEGVVEATYGIATKDDDFRAAVQSALDWGRFAPATVNGKPVPVYLGGTVFFGHQNGTPVIVVSLATQESERVRKMGNYIQPQLIGGLRREVAKIIRQIPHNFPVAGQAEAVVQVNARGAVTKTAVTAENPKGSGLGDLLETAIKGAQFTHAYDNGKPSAGAVNVVADFGKL